MKAYLFLKYFLIDILLLGKLYYFLSERTSEFADGQGFEHLEV